VTYYYWDFDTDNVFLEEDEDGDTIAEYTHEPGLYGELIAQERDGQVRYYNFDGQGSTRELTDENGDVTDTYTYTAFGEEIAHTGTTENPFRYKGALGYRTNSDPNDIYVRERIYEPTNGRWLSIDPLGVSLQNSHLYRYTENSPSNISDASGLLSTTSTGHYCPGCGSVCMKWLVKSKGLSAEGLVVQKICFRMNIVTCERRQECCKGTKRHACNVCYYEELFRFTDVQASVDTWSFPRILRTQCGQRGTATVSAQIRAYRFRREGYPKANWTDGSGTVKCGEFSIGASDFTLQEPGWWNAHVAEITSDMRAQWKCCEEDNQKSSLAYGASDGSHESSSCEDNVDPRWERDCFR
jgi:RHS repeat-associated protein